FILASYLHELAGTQIQTLEWCLRGPSFNERIDGAMASLLNVVEEADRRGVQDLDNTQQQLEGPVRTPRRPKSGGKISGCQVSKVLSRVPSPHVRSELQYVCCLAGIQRLSIRTGSGARRQDVGNRTRPIDALQGRATGLRVRGRRTLAGPLEPGLFP